MISMDALHKVIDASQLTQDLEGTLHYDHSVWIELRCVSRFDILLSTLLSLPHITAVFPLGVL